MKINMKSIRVIAALMLAVSASSCHRAQSGKRQFFVAFSQANNAEPYRAAQNELMTRLFAEAGDVKLVIADAQQDNSKQIAQVETFIRQHPDLLIVAPNERAALTAVMGEAMEQKIPVICLERDILQPNYTTLVHSDNLVIGRMAGEFIRDYLIGKYKQSTGKVVEIQGLLGVEAAINRHKGAADFLAVYPNIKVVADPVADWIQARAKDRMTEVLRGHPSIDVVYAHNDPMAVGAYLAAKELGREREMIFVGVDGLGGSAGGIKKVADGILAATFIYPLCVDKTVEVGLQILRNPSFHPAKEYTVAPQLVTPENAAELYKSTTSSTQ
jgi:ribose transport system substrate-binding protein